MVFGNDINSVAANCVKLDSGVDAQENIMLTYSDGRMASLYATMLAQTDRRGLINGTNGYIEIENINNYEMIRVFNLEKKIVAEYAAPTQITGYEYEVVSAMKAIREGRIECPEMPHIETLQMMQLMDSIRSAWGIVYPFERTVTSEVRKPFAESGITKKPEKKQESIVKKISEKSVSDTEYENVEKPEQKNAKEVRETLPTSSNKGITGKLPIGLVDEEKQPKKAFASKPIKPIAHNNPKAIREIDRELKVEERKNVGGVTEQIRRLKIDEVAAPVGSFTDRWDSLKNMEVDEAPAFQRRRSTPHLK